MIIRLHPHNVTLYNSQAQPLALRKKVSFKDRVRYDRWILGFLFTATAVLTAVFS